MGAAATPHCPGFHHSEAASSVSAWARVWWIGSGPHCAGCSGGPPHGRREGRTGQHGHVRTSDGAAQHRLKRGGRAAAARLQS